MLLAGCANLLVSHGSDTISLDTGNNIVFVSGDVVVSGGGAGRPTFVGQGGADTVADGAGMLTVFSAASGGVHTTGSGGKSVPVAAAGNTMLTGAPTTTRWPDSN